MKVIFAEGPLDNEEREIPDGSTEYVLRTPPKALHAGEPGALPLEARADYGRYKITRVMVEEAWIFRWASDA